MIKIKTTIKFSFFKKTIQTTSVTLVKMSYQTIGKFVHSPTFLVVFNSCTCLIIPSCQIQSGGSILFDLKDQRWRWNRLELCKLLNLSHLVTRGGQPWSCLQEYSLTTCKNIVIMIWLRFFTQITSYISSE